MKLNRDKLMVHAYRGIPEVRSWSYYKTIDKSWAVCGSRPIPGAKDMPDLPAPAPTTGTFGTRNIAKVTCAFCLDLIEDTQKRQKLIPVGRERVTIADSCLKKWAK